MDQEILTGIEEIDREHEEFLRHLELLRDAVQLGSGCREEVLRTLRYLDHFITEHFGVEERYMRLHHFTGILKHESEHAAFAKAFAALKNRILTEDAARGMEMSLLAIELEHRLRNWYEGHIATSDKKLGEYLAERL